jgi:hypothetical protein
MNLILKIWAVMFALMAPIAMLYAMVVYLEPVPGVTKSVHGVTIRREP